MYAKRSLPVSLRARARARVSVRRDARRTSARSCGRASANRRSVAIATTTAAAATTRVERRVSERWRKTPVGRSGWAQSSAPGGIRDEYTTNAPCRSQGCLSRARGENRFRGLGHARGRLARSTHQGGSSGRRSRLLRETEYPRSTEERRIISEAGARARQARLHFCTRAHLSRGAPLTESTVGRPTQGGGAERRDVTLGVEVPSSRSSLLGRTYLIYIYISTCTWGALGLRAAAARHLRRARARARSR